MKNQNKKHIGLYVFSLIIIFIAALFIFFCRFDFNFNAPIDNWLKTANFFNSLLTPPLLAITSILIFLTWETSKRELETTNSAISLDIQIKIYSAMLESFIRNLDKEVDLDIKERAFMRAWTELTSGEINQVSKDFQEKLLQDRVSKRERNYQQLCFQIPLTHRYCLSNYSNLVKITISGSKMSALDILKPVYKDHVIGEYRKSSSFTKEKKLPTIKNFIDLLDFIEKHKEQKTYKEHLIDLFLYYIDQATIYGVKFDVDIAKHPVYQIIEESLDHKNPL